MSKDINAEPYDEGTLTKLEIFERYLEAWLPVFIQTPFARSAAIWDFFAGTGQDSEGVPGSPLRSLHKVAEFRDQIAQKNMRIRLVFNEKKKRRAEALEARVEQERQSLSLDERVTVECVNQDFQEIFRERYEELRHQPNLVFIDQYGVKHVNRDIFGMLIALKRTDFLFFISSSTMKRFAETPEFSAIFPDFSPARVAKARIQDIHRIMLEYYRSMIPPDNPTRLYPFTLRKGANVYGLVFGSKHLRGVEKFLDLAWDKNKLNGEANFDIDEDLGKAQPVLFAEMRSLTKREKFENDLEEFIRQRGQTTNQEIYQFTIERGHPKAHARECLARLKREGKVEYPRRVGFSYDSCIGMKRRIVTIKAKDHG